MWRHKNQSQYCLEGLKSDSVFLTKIGAKLEIHTEIQDIHKHAEIKHRSPK